MAAWRDRDEWGESLWTARDLEGPLWANGPKPQPAPVPDVAGRDVRPIVDRDPGDETDAEDDDYLYEYDHYEPGVCGLCDYDRGRGLWYSPCQHEGEPC